MSESPRPLAAGPTVEDRLAAGELHAYGLWVEKDQFVHLIAEQLGLDVVLALFGPDGRQLAEVDSPTGREGSEEVTEVADAAGSYRLEVRPVAGDGGAGDGTYRLRVAEQRPATLADRLRVAAERAFGSGEGSRRRGEVAAARESYRLASELWRDAKNPRGEALAAYRLGWMEDLLNRPDAASAQYGRALDRLDEGEDPALRATILNRWGRNQLTQGLEKSRAAHERAYLLFRALKNAAGQATSLHNLGRAYAGLGASQRAKEHYELAVALWRQVGDAAEEANTLRHLAGLAGLPGGSPGAGQIPERSQALAPDTGGGTSRAARAAASTGDRQGEVVALAALGAALARDGKLQEAADCHARIFASHLDTGMCVLWYQLGEDGSRLWTVTADGRGSHHALPRRVEIEAAARRVFDSVAQDDDAPDGPLGRAAAELSEMLLAPAASELGAERLLLVVEGALDRVPFALLPEPAVVDGREAGAAVPLLARHEIVHLSPGILPLAVGRRPARRQGVMLGPAVVADPVLRHDDPRLGQAPAGAAAGPAPERPPAVEASLRGLGLAELPALPFSRPEAEAVAAQVPAGGRSCALGFDAGPEALSALARRYRVLHVAALALLSPGGSGVVLTLYDRQGVAKAGFLPLADLARQELPLGLIVVTGSRIAWEAPEGGLGLAQAAMQAGAARAVTSLWSAEDESATELLRRFYQEMLGKRLEPAAALRQAQLSIAADPRWRSPRHWAGFTFAGTWDRGVPAEAAGSSDGSIEINDTGGTGGSGKPPTDYPPPPQPDTGAAGGAA